MKKLLRKIYRTFLDLRFGNEPNSLKLLISNNLKQLVWVDEIVGKRIATNRYELNETNFFKTIVKPEDTCLDIGSNIGYFTQLFASLAKNGKVISIEANERNSSLIKLNTFINNFNDRVIVLNTAVSNEDDQVIDFNSTTDSACGFVQTSNEREVYSYMDLDGLDFKVNSLMKVNTSKVDTILKKLNINKIDILKMDIEGFEYFALMGMNELLGNIENSPRIMLIELVDEHLKYYNQSLEEVIEFVKGFGYVPNNLIKGKIIPYDASLNESNIIFTK